MLQNEFDRLNSLSRTTCGRHFFLAVCRNCSVVFAEFACVSRVPYAVACPCCGFRRKTRFVKCFRGQNFQGVPLVFVTSVNSRLGRMVLSLVSNGLVQVGFSN